MFVAKIKIDGAWHWVTQITAYVIDGKTLLSGNINKRAYFTDFNVCQDVMMVASDFMDSFVRYEITEWCILEV